MKRKETCGLYITLLCMGFCLIALPAQAHELTIHPNNLNALANPAYGLQWEKYQASPLQELLKYSSIVNLDITKPYTKKSVNVPSRVSGVGKIVALQVGDGECPTFVKAVTKHGFTTTYWTKGRRVKGNEKNIPAGTIIAAFGSYNKYSSIPTKLKHVAVFGDYTGVSVNVWDQNYVGYPQKYHVVGRHSLSYSGTQPNNLDYYYVVNVPDNL